MLKNIYKWVFRKDYYPKKYYEDIVSFWWTGLTTGLSHPYEIFIEEWGVQQQMQRFNISVSETKSESFAHFLQTCLGYNHIDSVETLHREAGTWHREQRRNYKQLREAYKDLPVSKLSFPVREMAVRVHDKLTEKGLHSTWAWNSIGENYLTSEIRHSLEKMESRLRVNDYKEAREALSEALAFYTIMDNKLYAKILGTDGKEELPFDDTEHLGIH